MGGQANRKEEIEGRKMRRKEQENKNYSLRQDVASPPLVTRCVFSVQTNPAANFSTAVWLSGENQNKKEERIEQEHKKEEGERARRRRTELRESLRTATYKSY